MEEEKAQTSKVMGTASLGLELGVQVQESNPMLNSVVLQNLFKIVPLGDLKNMRGVCKLWWELSLPVFRSSCQIHIHGEKRRTIENYMALISSTEDDKFGFLLCFRHWRCITLKVDPDLRFFGIAQALSTAAILSEDAVKNGLLQLTSLNDISVYCSLNMSEETFTQLCEKYPKSFIHRSYY